MQKRDREKEKKKNSVKLSSITELGYRNFIVVVVGVIKIHDTLEFPINDRYITSTTLT